MGTDSRLQCGNRRQVGVDLWAGVRVRGSVFDVSTVKDRERVPLSESPRLETSAPPHRPLQSRGFCLFCLGSPAWQADLLPSEPLGKPSAFFTALK